MSGKVVGIVGRKEGKKQVPTNQLGNREESSPGIRSLEGVFRLPRSKRLLWPPPQVSPWVGEGGGASIWSLAIRPRATEIHAKPC